MAVTAATLIDEIRYELKDLDTSQPNFSNTELLGYLSDASEALVRHIAAQWPYYWLRTGQAQSDVQNIVNGTQNYDLPAEAWLVVAVSAKDSDDETELLDALTFERTFDDAAEGYFLQDDDVYLYPEPDANVVDGLTVYYMPLATRLTATTDNVALAREWRAWLKEYAIIKCKARQEENPAAFAALFRRAEDEINSMMHKTNMGTGRGMTIPRRRWL